MECGVHWKDDGEETKSNEKMKRNERGLCVGYARKVSFHTRVEEGEEEKKEDTEEEEDSIHSYVHARGWRLLFFCD